MSTPVIFVPGVGRHALQYPTSTPLQLEAIEQNSEILGMLGNLDEMDRRVPMRALLCAQSHHVPAPSSSLDSRRHN